MAYLSSLVDDLGPGAVGAAPGPRDEEETRDRLARLLAERVAALSPAGATETTFTYLAHDRARARPVQLRVLTAGAAADPRQVALFRLEARAAAGLSHQHILKAGEAESIAGIHFQVTDHEPGDETLSALLEREGWLEVGRAVDIGRQMAAALGHAHQAGVCHLNLQPDQVLVAAGGEVKITGFGIAGDQQWDWARRARAARCRPCYLSPEQAEGRPGDGLSDLFSLGVILYQMLTDRLPYDSHDLDDLRHKHQVRSPWSPHLLRPDLPADLSELVMELLSTSPDARSRRFRTGAEVGSALALLRPPEQGPGPQPGRAGATLIRLPESNEWRFDHVPAHDERGGGEAPARAVDRVLQTDAPGAPVTAPVAAAAAAGPWSDWAGHGRWIALLTTVSVLGILLAASLL